MKKYLRIAVGAFALIFCILSGCEGKEKQQDELLLLTAYEDNEEDTDLSMLETDEQPEESTALEKTVRETYVVHICGAVERPGVYILGEGSRVYQAIEKAGGFREDADEDYLNQADILTDGMKLYVPTREEVEQVGEAGNWQNMYNSAGIQNEKTLVNINTAGEEILCTLPGVGSTKAKSIIDYREKNGAFQKTEDIMNVDGIKDGLYQKIKDSITV